MWQLSVAWMTSKWQEATVVLAFYKAQFIFIQNHSGRAYVVFYLNSNSKHSHALPTADRWLTWPHFILNFFNVCFGPGSSEKWEFPCKVACKKTAFELILNLCVAQFFCSLRRSILEERVFSLIAFVYTVCSFVSSRFNLGWNERSLALFEDQTHKILQSICKRQRWVWLWVREDRVSSLSEGVLKCVRKMAFRRILFQK